MNPDQLALLETALRIIQAGPSFDPGTLESKHRQLLHLYYPRLHAEAAARHIVIDAFALQGGFGHEP